jgi:O-antigen ligase
MTWIIRLHLWGIFLLKFTLPLLLALVLSSVGTLIRAANGARIDKLFHLVFFNLGLWFLSGLASSGFVIRDLFSKDFFGGEGRAFISYIPFLFFLLTNARARDVRALYKTLIFLAQISLLLFFIWKFTGSEILSVGKAANFGGFFTSHTGSGTFFGFTSLILVVYGIHSGDKKAVLWGGLALLPLIGSASREALLAFLAASIWYLLKARHWRAIAGVLVVTAVLVAIMPLASPHTWQRTVGLFAHDLVRNIAITIERGEWQPGHEEIELEGSQQNVLLRILYWKYAIERFSESPLLGIGFGRFDDPDPRFSGIKGLIYVATDGERIYSSAGGAHNSFLQMLSEVGLVGLLLLLWLWLALYSRMRLAASRYRNWKHVSAFFISAQAGVVFCLTAALTGHALAAPSLMLPALTVLGTALAYQRFLATTESCAVGKPSRDITSHSNSHPAPSIAKP